MPIESERPPEMGLNQYVFIGMYQTRRITVGSESSPGDRKTKQKNFALGLPESALQDKVFAAMEFAVRMENCLTFSANDS